MTMKLDKDTLLDVLRQQNTWVDSTFLTEIFNVSSRTIRNYVSKINENLETPLRDITLIWNHFIG